MSRYLFYGSVLFKTSAMSAVSHYSVAILQAWLFMRMQLRLLFKCLNFFTISTEKWKVGLRIICKSAHELSAQTKDISPT